MSGESRDGHAATTGPSESADGPDAPPPILGSWSRAYAVIVLELAVTVLLLYALARWAA